MAREGKPRKKILERGQLPLALDDLQGERYDPRPSKPRLARKAKLGLESAHQLSLRQTASEGTGEGKPEAPLSDVQKRQARKSKVGRGELRVEIMAGETSNVEDRLSQAVMILMRQRGSASH